jgi:hypothetical protein
METYPNIDILMAELGSHPSQVWRSMLEGTDVLLHGIIRRIGGGSTTRIWADNWIPRDASMRPIVCMANDPPVLVSKLIDNTSVVWRDDKLQQYFLPADVTAIKNISLCTSPMSDFWAWQIEKKGEFSVRSAYRMLASIRNSREDLLGQRGADSYPMVEEKC